MRKLILRHFNSNKVVLECDITDLTIDIVDVPESEYLKQEADKYFNGVEVKSTKNERPVNSDSKT
jgi:hypothetical protein